MDQLVLKTQFLSWSRFSYFGKSGLVQISLFWQIWTSPDLTFCESGPAGVENTIFELVQISLFWQIWTSPDFPILENLDWSRFPYFGKSGLVQICLFLKSGLVRISLFLKSGLVQNLNLDLTF